MDRRGGAGWSCSNLVVGHARYRQTSSSESTSIQRRRGTGKRDKRESNVRKLLLAFLTKASRLYGRRSSSSSSSSRFFPYSLRSGNLRSETDTRRAARERACSRSTPVHYRLERIRESANRTDSVCCDLRRAAGPPWGPMVGRDPLVSGGPQGSRAPAETGCTERLLSEQEERLLRSRGHYCYYCRYYCHYAHPARGVSLGRMRDDESSGWRRAIARSAVYFCGRTQNERWRTI